MKSVIKEYPPEEYERFAEKEFIEWLIEDLDSDYLSLLLYSIGIEKTARKGVKLPKQFLRNKLLLNTARKKLRDKEIFPPFSWVMNIEGELTADTLIKEAENQNESMHDTALALFLQNHYEESFKIYEKRKSRKKNQKTDPVLLTEVDKEKSIPAEESFSPKREKKMVQKIENLEQECDRLSRQLKEVQNELKEKNIQKQQEINKLNQMHGSEKKEKEQLINEVNFLKRENDELKKKLKKNAEIVTEPKRQEPKISKKKIAFLGNPKNRSILKSDDYEADVIEPETFAKVKLTAGNYHIIYLLSWRFPIQEFEAIASNDLKQKTTVVESFPQLKIKLGELTSVK